jgi:hypothetical protein
MNSKSTRSYRKNLITNGLIYINGEEQEVSVVNMSIAGVLVQLNHKSVYSSDTESTLNDSLASTIIDFYLPQLSLAGTAEVVRVHINEHSVSLALEFKDITYNINNLLYKRRVYRKNMSVEGQILLNNGYYNFHTINVSVEGLMIRLAETLNIVEGMTTSFEFNNLSLKGEVEVVWVDFDADDKTLLGLKYINMNTSKIKGIPRFSTAASV